jgi:hypothetical protein
MGRDLTIYPIKATKVQLRELIESHGFTRCKHLWDWPKGTLNYSWFESRDFLSIDGVSADIYPISVEERRYTKNEWAVHVRNVYSASVYDVKKLNTVLKDIRQKYGGTIKGDYGTNKYAPLWEDDSTPISRGVTFVVNHVNREIKSLLFAMPESSMKYPEQDDKNDSLIEIMKSMDPIRVVYNAFVPFIISAFEYFFSQTFQILLKYDDKAIEKMTSYTQKIQFDKVLEITKGQNTIEALISDNYSFQNIGQINKAFKEWFDIDINKVLFKKKKIGNRVKYLQSTMNEIIQFRHGIIHHFNIDSSLTKDEVINMLKVLQLVINEMVICIEQKYVIKIEQEI